MEYLDSLSIPEFLDVLDETDIIINQEKKEIEKVKNRGR
jgi:hypothetical protein